MAKEERILVVEDDERVRNALTALLKSWSYNVEVAADASEGREKIVSFNPVVVLSDLKMPGLSGLDLLKEARELNPGIHFIMLTGHGTIQDAVEATKLGAFNFLEKPVDIGRLQIELRNCLAQHESERQLQIAHRKLRDLGALGNVVGRSKKMQEVLYLVSMVAPSPASVLITGESGTGKEVVARTIHELSPNRHSPFVAVNCAAIPESLMESELFGHEKGAFTGAVEQRMGCFELAHGGTLLLDEIGEMPRATQAKLLRVLEDSRVRRLGAKAEIQVSVRVLASTNRVPEEAVESGQFRSDLFYRLNVVRIQLPALRERMEDLEDLAQALLLDLSRKYDQPVKALDADALDLARRYSWPGNVRELRNSLERALITCGTKPTISPTDLSPLLGTARQPASSSTSEGPKIEVGLTVAETERRLILETMSFTKNNKTRAAEILGITPKTLHKKLQGYGNGPSAAGPAVHSSKANGQ
jgi:DNA-binding NtrC family response regulator